LKNFMKLAFDGRLQFGFTLLLIGSSCSSPKLHDEFRRVLETADAQVERGEYARAADELESLIGRANSDLGEYELQRFHADVLLARTHLLASSANSFLPEAASARPRVGAIEASTRASGAAQGSSTAHLAACAAAMGYADDWSEAAASAELDTKRALQLPANRQQGGVGRALREMELAALILDVRLGFQNKVDRALDATTALTELDKCQAVMEDVHLPASLRPWVYLAVYDYLRPRDEVKAFPFALQLLATSPDLLRTLPRQSLTGARTWLVDESKYTFVCPNCSTPIVPEYSDCQNCHTPTLQFRAVPKVPARN